MRWTVVGVGTAGRARAAAIAAHPESELVGVWRGRYAADVGAPVLPDLDAALRADAIAICSPSAAHPEQVARALAAGLHVTCEYPLAADPETAARLFEAADRAGRTLHVGHIELLTGPAVHLGGAVRPAAVRAAHVGFTRPGTGAEDAEAQALGNVARLMRLVAVAGPVAQLTAVDSGPGWLTAAFTHEAGARSTLDLRSGPGLPRRTTLTVHADHVWHQEDDRLTRDGAPVEIPPSRGLFAADHALAHAEAMSGRSSVPTRAQILHVIALAKSLF